MVKTDKLPFDTLLRLKQGDHACFLAVYDAYHRGLYTFAKRYLRDGQSAEDVVHDVFMKLWEIRERIDPHRPLINYLFSIARNAIYKALKKRLDTAELNAIAEDSDLRSHQPSTEDEINYHEYEQLLEIAINALPPQRQKVFKLCRQQGKTYEEVALQLQISPYTVKEHMSLAMKSLRDYLGKEF